MHAMQWTEQWNSHFAAVALFCFLDPTHVNIIIICLFLFFSCYSRNFLIASASSFSSPLLVQPDFSVECSGVLNSSSVSRCSLLPLCWEMSDRWIFNLIGAIGTNDDTWWDNGTRCNTWTDEREEKSFKKNNGKNNCSQSISTCCWTETESQSRCWRTWKVKQETESDGNYKHLTKQAAEDERHEAEKRNLIRLLTLNFDIFISHCFFYFVVSCAFILLWRIIEFTCSVFIVCSLSFSSFSFYFSFISFLCLRFFWFFSTLPF